MAEGPAPSLHKPPAWIHRSERFMTVAAVLLGVFALVVAVGLASLVRVNEAVIQGGVRNRESRVASYNLIQSSIDAETGERGFLLTDDPSFLEPYENGRVAAAENIARLRALWGDDPQFAPRLNRVEELSHRVFASMTTTLEQQRTHGLTRREARAAISRSKTVMDTLRVELNGLLQEVENRITIQRDSQQRTTNALYLIGGLLSVFSLMAVALTILALRSERRSWRAAFDALTEANMAAEDARERAAESDLAKTRFLAVASHDMRQPLHALTLYLSALERRVEGEEARGIIHKMERATESMATMFATLLDLARIQAGVVTPDIHEFPLQDVFDRIQAENPGGRLEITPTSIALQSDPVLVERMLRNLVSNAVKHGGGRARLAAVIVGRHAEISVSDNGPGILEEDQARIFDEFVRLEGRAEGLGLGLAIVKRIADMLNIPIKLTSSPGRGARFTLQATLAGAGARPTPRAQNPVAHLQGAQVLVIDDDTLAREAIAGAMSDLGAVVRAGANEFDGRAILADGFAPRLMMMDLRIDGELAGIEIAKRLRASVNPQPRVIVVTGDTGPETLALLRNSGFAWLIKPVSPQALSEAAAQQLAAA